MSLHAAAGDIHQPYKLYCKFVKIDKDWHASDGWGKILANEKNFRDVMNQKLDAKTK